MKLLSRIIHSLKPKPVQTEGLKPWPHPIDGTRPEPAFKIGGVTYYHFENDLHARTKRFFAAQDYYTELKFNLDRETLAAYFEEVLKACRKGELDRVAILTHELQKRLQWIKNFDLLYKLWTVVYFDANEDPHDFDFAYAAKKIERVKAVPGVPAFFFRKPICEYLPFLDISNLDMHHYLEIQKVQRESQKALSELLSSTRCSMADSSAGSI